MAFFAFRTAAVTISFTEYPSSALNLKWLAPKVFVVTTSDPALRYSLWISVMISGLERFHVPGVRRASDPGPAKGFPYLRQNKFVSPSSVPEFPWLSPIFFNLSSERAVFLSARLATLDHTGCRCPAHPDHRRHRLRRHHQITLCQCDPDPLSCLQSVKDLFLGR